MTELENFRAIVEHRRPEWIPFGMGFTPDLARRVVEHIGTDDIAGHYGMWRPAWVGPKVVGQPPKLDFSRYWQGEDLPEGTQINGLGVAEVPAQFYHFTGYISPLRNATSLAEIEDYPVQDPAVYDWQPAVAEVAAAHAAGRSVMIFVGHMYENAWQARGYEQFLMDTIERPAWAECLLDKFFRQNYHTAIGAARAGVDYIYCGDDVASQKAMMFSKDTWRTLILSRWRRCWQAIKEIDPRCAIGYHTDGNCTDIVGEMLDAGLDFLNPVQPECVDADELKARFGERLGLHGCIGTQSTMPFGTADDVRARVRECVEKYGQRGGLILSPTHVLEPEVPLANIDALAEACRQYGTLSS
ncbi:MAG: uroporphyrinogen decarboxylase family protein [Planctomycetaceae bacterium]|nr:uroporphyrinogen decarboxylase family protein [Planctomycetaceae bacterium]